MILRVKKSDLVFKSFICSLLIHVLLLGVFIVSISLAPTSFKPQLAFLGAVVVDQNIFGNIKNIDRKDAGETRPAPWLVKTHSSDHEKSFMLNKPLIGTAPKAKKAKKTTFSTQDITKDTPEKQDLNIDMEGYKYKPLRLGGRP